MTASANQVHDGPMSLHDLQILSFKRGELSPAQSTVYEYGNHREITDTAQVVTVGFLQQHSSLILGQPVSGAGSKLLCAFDSANACSELRTEQARICSFIRQSPDCSKALICPKPNEQKNTCSHRNGLQNYFATRRSLE